MAVTRDVEMLLEPIESPDVCTAPRPWSPELDRRELRPRSKALMALHGAAGALLAARGAIERGDVRQARQALQRLEEEIWNARRQLQG